jgi:tellurite resistance protein TerA
MGTVTLTKGASHSLSKNRPLQARITWPALTDYDAGAEIIYKNGTRESIATFPTVTASKQIISPKKLTSRNGTVRHGGDAVRGVGTATETITVDPDADIESIAFWAYSAQSNGTGSFREYAVTMEVTDGTDTVRIDASDASDNPRIYTCVPGMITFTDGVPKVDRLEMYSEPTSENRPGFRQKGLFKQKTVFVVDGGEKNGFK